MPSVGRFSSSKAFASFGEVFRPTLAGPPERMIAFGFFARRCSGVTEKGSISQYTPRLRTERAMSWVNCEPKSRMTTGDSNIGTIVGSFFGYENVVDVGLFQSRRRDLHELGAIAELVQVTA